MFFSSDHRGVCIFVRGQFVAPREWLIHATVESGSEAHGADGAAFRQRTLSQLWQAIQLERRVGRQLGATVVRVVVEGDLDIARLFAATANPVGFHADPPAYMDQDTFKSVPHQDASSA
jgi:hypothetical protein